MAAATRRKQRGGGSGAAAVANFSFPAGKCDFPAGKCDRNLQPKDLELRDQTRQRIRAVQELYSLLAVVGGGDGDDADDEGDTVGRRSVVDASQGDGCGTSS